jgi:ABC-2 type transport system permease protein
MGKVWIIIQREYLMGVRNKAFIVLCFVAPLFFAGLVIIPTVIASQPGEDRTIVVCDNSSCPDSIGYAFIFKDTLNLKFDYGMVYKPIGDVKKAYRDSDNVSVLWIPENFMGGCDTINEHSIGLKCGLFSRKEPGLNTVNLLEKIMSNQVQMDILAMNGVSAEAMELSKRKVLIESKVNDQVSDAEVKFMSGLFFGLIIYIYILIFGVRVMKSVQEEKSTRIVEVIVSSVRPFQLLMGKIVAVALVALTQFTAWIILSMLILLPVVSAINDQKLDFTKLQQNTSITTAMTDDSGSGSVMGIPINENTIEVMEKVGSIPWSNVIPIFVFYFIFGYLMYAAMFAAMGSAADTDTDTAQFSVPVTVPLMIAMASFVVVQNDPHGTIAKWLSMIPFTSPVVMIMRIPYGGMSITEVAISMTILVVSFVVMTWLAGRVYRVGILMYGKKTSWRELFKWIFYKG